MNRLMTAVVAALLAFGTSLSAQKPAVPNSRVWSLYRNSVTDATMRLHIATFDSVDDTGTVSEAGLTYNGANCEVARGLFQGQDGVKVKFWCEQGRAK